MTDTPFLRLLASFKTEPEGWIEFPPAGEARQAICDEAKRAIRAALNRGEVELAERIVNLIGKAAHQTQEAEVVASANWCKGLFWLHREPRLALSHLEQARDFYRGAARNPEAARVSVGIAGLLGQMGRFAEAQATIQFCIQNLPSDYGDWMVVYINLSDIQGRQGDYSAMLHSARQAEQIAAERNAPVFVTMAVINQGYAALFLEQPALAGERLRQALKLAQENEFADLAGRAATALSHFSVDRGDLFAALDYLRQARAAFETAQIEMEQAEIAKEQARLYERLNMPAQARQAAIFAARRFEQVGLLAEGTQAWLTAVHIALTQEQPERARRDLEQVRHLLEHASPLLQSMTKGYAAHPLFCKTRAVLERALCEADQVVAEIARLNITGEQLEMELLAAQLAAALKLPNALHRSVRVTEQARQQQLPDLEYHACIQQANLLHATRAEPVLRRAVAITVLQRQQMPVAELKANLLSGQSDLYQHLIAAQLKTRQFIAATETLIDAKAGLWADLLTPLPATPPDETWLRAKAELRYWQDFLPEAHEIEATTLCRQKIAQAEAALIAMARSQVHQRRLQPVPLLVEVLSGLPEDGPVLEYWVHKQQILVCVLNAGQPPRWVTLGKTKDVLYLLGRWQVLQAEMRHCQTPSQRMSVAQNQHSAAQSLFAQLYQLLIAPLEALLQAFQRIILAPDQFLFDIPWAALYGQNAYLGERYQFSLIPSAALETIHQRMALPEPAFSPPLLLGWAGQPPLSYVQEELAALRQAIPEARCVYPAGLTDLQWNVSPRFLHIATHGRIHASAPLLSGLEFADGTLLLADVFNLALHGTRLVTLSACDTGIPPERGSVMLALAGAFLLAGAQNVFASLWPVEDQATQVLMDHFYRDLQAGQTLPHAVQFAQQAARDAGYDHPYYWAAFQLLGSRTIIA